jgi:diaminopimelate decarboxylase
MLDSEFQPEATTIDSKEELDRLIQAGLPRDVVLYVRIKAHGKGIGTNLSLKFGTGFSRTRGVDDATPLLKMAHEAGFTKLGVAFHVGTQCCTPESYGASLRHCLEITKKMFRSDPSIKVTHFNIGGGFSDERVAMRNSTGARQVLANVSGEVGRFREAAEKVVGERVHIIAEPGRVTCAPAGTLLSRVIEDHESPTTAMRVRIAMTSQGGLSGNVHDGQYFATEPLYPKESDTNISVLVVGNSNRPGEIFPSTQPDRAHILPVGIKAGDWLMFPEAGVAYGWNASGAADGIDPGILMAFYTDDNGEYHFIESPWSNREALRNAEVRRWYYSQQH